MSLSTIGAHRPSVQLPRIQATTAGWLFAVMMSIAVVQGLSMQASLGPSPPQVVVFFVCGAISAWVALPVVQFAVLNAGELRASPSRFATVHLLAYATGALLAKTLQLALVSAATSSLGMPLQLQSFWSEFLTDVPTSAAVHASEALLFAAFYAAKREFDTSRANADLEGALLDARAATLQARLDRAQLRKRLRLVGAKVADDPDAAEAALQQLGDELREAIAPPVELGASVASVGAPAWEVYVEPVADIRWPRVSGRGAVRALMLCFTLSLVGAAACHLGRPEQAVFSYTRGAIRALSLWPSLLVPLAVVQSQPDPRASWRRWLGLHAAALAAFVCLLSATEHGLTLACLAMANFAVPTPRFTQTVSAELQYASNTYMMLVGGGTALHFWQQSKKAALRARELAMLLSHTRLAALTARIDPHFLYNALNSISELVHEAPALGAQLIESLSALFDTLLGDTRATWSVREERDHLERYLDFVRARFSERVEVETKLPNSLDPYELPRFALQGLVENAVKHNQHRRNMLRVLVSGERRGSQLLLSVHDDGEGFPAASTNPHGGLERLRQSLHHLYLDGAQLHLEGPGATGARVSLLVPAVEAKRATAAGKLHD